MIQAANKRHPDRDQLIAFNLGRMDDDQSSWLEGHLQECEPCCLLLTDLDDDAFVGLVKQAGSVPTSWTTGPDGVGTSARANEHPGGLPEGLRDHPRYRVQDLIGRGGMGMVYRAEHLLMNRPVAIKVIDPSITRHPQAVARFHREIRAAARLSHPNIVAAFDAETAGDAHYLVMEFVDGIDLASLVRRDGPLSVANACRFIGQVARGMQHAADRGMTHRDIKPQNLILARDGTVRILDFGLAAFAAPDADPSEIEAQVRPDPSSELTRIGSILGTPDFIAPEQVEDPRSADTRSDIYSLGCTLYFLLAGHPPFLADSAQQVLKLHRDGRFPEIGESRPDVPASMAEAIRRMTAPNPDRRFSEMRQVEATMDTILTSIPAQAPTELSLPSKSARFHITTRRILLMMTAVSGIAATVFLLLPPAASPLYLAITGTGRGSIDPAQLVGLWEVVKADDTPVGSTLEFGNNGKFASRPNAKDRSDYDGTYKIKDDQVTIEPAGMSVTVKELSKNKLVLDGFGGIVEYKRKGAAIGATPKAVQRSGGFTFGATPKAQGAPRKWVVVKSKEDGFSVEMPGEPNGSESGGEMGFETRGMSHQTRTLEFSVTAITGPTEIPESEVAKAIVGIRDKTISKHGDSFKVVAEKSVKLGAFTGQEFDVTLDRRGVGPVTLRGRVFAHAKRAYVLLVMPMVKNKDLPTDAAKFLESFSLTGNSEDSVKVKPREKAGSAKGGSRKGSGNAKEWGREVDPDSDVEIKMEASSLTMDIPGTPHILAPERSKMNAPRVVAPTRGDFAVSAKVNGAFKPGRESTVKGLSSRQAAGLLIWKDEENYLVLQHRASWDDGKAINQVILEEIVGGKKGAQHRQPIADGPIHLKLDRSRGRVTASFSTDGNIWKEMKPVDTTWSAGSAEVGPIAVNTSIETHSVTFTDYSLKVK